MLERQNIYFKSEGQRCSGWFYPAGQKKPSPCVVLAHGFGATKEMRLGPHAENLARAGYNALAFDYRHFGDSEGEPRQILDIKKQHQDLRAALHFARELPGVDPRKMVLCGMALGGGHVVEVAVRENGIAAVISTAPHLDGMATALAPGLLQSLRLGMAGLRDLIRVALRQSPYYVPIFGPPGKVAALTVPGAEAGVRSLYSEGTKPDERVAARIFLQIGGYSPGKLAPRLKVPWLVQAGAQDPVVPARAAVKAAMNAPCSKIITYQCGHFEAFLPPYSDQIVADQIMFLQDCLK